jgi:transcriptional regulator with XRE-family HTH domain
MCRFVKHLPKILENFPSFQNIFWKLFNTMLITGKTLSEQMLQKRKELNLSVQSMARLLNLPADNIYKWQKGTRPLDLDHVRKLERFIEGRFDLFVNQGKLPANYEYENAVAKIFPRTPTNDFVNEPQPSNMLMEDERIIVLQKEIIKLQAEQIEQLKKELHNPKANNNPVHKRAHSA